MRLRTLSLPGLAALVLAGCGSNSSPTAAYDPIIDPNTFVAAITNPFLPLTPGTVLRYDGQSEDGVEIDSVIVTTDTKLILGVTTTVVRDVVWTDGSLNEETFDWYAQDAQGNVWYFGEDSRSYRDGQVVSTEGSWEAGQHGAKPGIVMEASPKVGDSYRQEYRKGVAEDQARVLGVDETVTVPYGAFTHCLLTEDWSDLESDVREHKHYCPGVGQVREETVRGGSDRSELTSVAHP
jgi:hypothetical protein